MRFSAVRVFDGVRFLDGPTDVVVHDGLIADAAPQSSRSDEVIEGGALFPGFVDAHVHLSFSTPEAVLAGGVTTVLDLGEPEDYAFSAHDPLTVKSSGPIITAPHGYPTRSWGAGGFGLEVANPAEARSAVARLAERGAAIIKMAVEPAGGALLDGDTMTAVVDAAHDRGLLVAAHALGAPSVASALDAGVDVLAHTPVETLPAALVGAIAKRGIIVISTVRAFGGAQSAKNNLSILAQEGARICYGTDLGNDGTTPGIDVGELAILTDALGSEDAALAAATSVAGALAGHGGRIAVGADADLVWLERYETLADLGGQKTIWKQGKRLA